MCYNKPRTGLTLTTFFILSFTFNGFAQSWSVSRTTAKTAENCLVYIESIYHSKSEETSKNDTLIGTAFLVNDGDKIYMVTTKHIIQATLYDKNQQLANNNIFLSTSNSSGSQLMMLDLSGWSENKRPFLFSSDDLDIAVISFQKTAYQPVLTALLSKHKAVSIDSIDTSLHLPDDSIFHSSYLTYKDHGKRVRVLGLAPARIKTINPKQPTFVIDELVNPGADGSPLFYKNKIVGVFKNQEGVSNNADIIHNFYRQATSATIVKAIHIIDVLKKLQEKERLKGFSGN